MKQTRKLLLLFAVLCCGIGAAAQRDSSFTATVERPVLSAYALELGASHLADTYLSPLKYSGISLGLDYERMQAMRFNPERWVMRLHGALSAESTKNPAGNATIYGINLSLGWGMMHRWLAAKNVTLAVGGSTDINGGVLYAARNSNNPASAKGSWTVNLAALAAYSGKMGKIPFCARYIVETPLSGIFFSPDYGQLYYEIYLGNHNGLVHYAHPANFFRLNNLVSIDLNFGRTSLRLGYRCNIASTKVSEIVARDISHCATVGIVSEWISLNPGRKNIDGARIISSLY